MDNVIQGAGSFGSFSLPTTALSKVQVLHMLPTLLFLAGPKKADGCAVRI